MTISENFSVTYPAQDTQKVDSIVIDFNGEHGVNGTGFSKQKDGGDGQNAGKRVVTITADTANRLFMIEVNKKQYQYRFNEHHKTFSLLGRGGDGGRGLDGTPGKDGEDGVPGIDATKTSYGKRGGCGSHGSNGRAGGHGGNGGNGGLVIVKVHKHCTDALMFFQDIDLARGIGGSGGRGGSGGKGGLGGRGGKQYNWSVMRDSYHGPIMCHYYKPGGEDGVDGRPGKDGRDGHSGRDGRDGRLEIRVKNKWGIKKYSSIYKLSISELKVEGEYGSDVFEPGEHVKCWVTVKNSGGMPTPKEQCVFIGLKLNQWIHKNNHFENKKALPGGLKPGAEYVFASPFTFTIGEPHSPYGEIPLSFSALMDRVQTRITSIENQKYCIRVKSPIDNNELYLLPGGDLSSVYSNHPVLSLTDDLSSRYYLLKKLKFDLKLEQINQLLYSEDLSVLVQAILSDIAEEQKMFCFSPATIEDLKNLKKLCEYQDLIGKEVLMFTIYCHIDFLIFRLRNSRSLAKYVNITLIEEAGALINGALKFLKGNLVVSRRKSIKNRVKLYNQFARSTAEVLHNYCKPPDVGGHLESIREKKMGL